MERVGMRGGWGWTLCNGFNLHKPTWTSSGESTRDSLALPPTSIYEHAPSPVPAAWATVIQRSLLPAPPTRPITMCRAPKIYNLTLGASAISMTS